MRRPGVYRVNRLISIVSAAKPREQGDRGRVAGQGEQHRGARESDGQSQVVARLLGHGNGASAR